MADAVAPVMLPIPSTAKYGAVIDAGSSGSRIFVYKWEGVGGKPRTISKVFPASKAQEEQAVKSGGIQTKGQDQETMNAYLRPLLQAAERFLRLEPHSSSSRFPIYLLSTGGMRLLPKKRQDEILDMAYKTIQPFNGTFDVGHRETATRVITGELEGLYGWIALNYARQSSEPIIGLAEMGGASIQFAFEDNDLNSRVEKKRPVCLPSKPEGHIVYSSTWDGYGADAMRASMLQMLSNDAGLDCWILDNPCLPRGRFGQPQGVPARWSVGTGDFRACRVLAKRLLDEGSKTRLAIPSYANISTSTDHFVAVSSYWYNYQFFGQWDFYSPEQIYDPALFQKAAEYYCSHKWGTFPVDSENDKFSEGRCFGAAWMLALLHDREHGFDLDTAAYGSWKDNFAFPTTPSLSERSSWTLGAAALIAQYNALKFCPHEDELELARSVETSSWGKEPPPIVHPRIHPGPGNSGSVSRLSGFPTSAEPSVPSITRYILLLLTLLVVLYRSILFWSKRASRPPATVDDASTYLYETKTRYGSIA